MDVDSQTQGFHAQCSMMVAAKKLTNHCEPQMMSWLEAGRAMTGRGRGAEHKRVKLFCISFLLLLLGRRICCRMLQLLKLRSCACEVQIICFLLRGCVQTARHVSGGQKNRIVLQM